MKRKEYDDAAVYRVSRPGSISGISFVSDATARSNSRQPLQYSAQNATYWWTASGGHQSSRSYLGYDRQREIRVPTAYPMSERVGGEVRRYRRSARTGFKRHRSEVVFRLGHETEAEIADMYGQTAFAVRIALLVNRRKSLRVATWYWGCIRAVGV